MTKTIVLDYGHGNKHSDKRGFINGSEGVENFNTGKLIKRELEKYGFKVLETRPEIHLDPSLDKRATMYSGDLFLSIHSNAFNGEAYGTEIFRNVFKYSNLGEKMLKTICDSQGTASRGVKEKRLDNGNNWYGVLRGNKSKESYLIEFAFHDNPHDVRKYLMNREKTAINLAKTIANHYNISEQITNNDNTKLYKVQVGAYKERNNALKKADELKKKGFETYIVYE